MIDLALVAGLLVLVSLFFAYTNGFQDSSAIVATLVACKAATPEGGVLYSAAFGFLGALLGGSAVAFTIEGLISVSPGSLLLYILVAAVVSSSSWNLITWWFGVPSSSTHALIGGLIGGAVAGAGIGSISWGVEDLLSGTLTGLTKVFFFLFLSVLIGFLGGYILKKISMVALRNAKRTANTSIRRVQLLTAAVLAFAHGANDSQKQMGVITLGLISAGLLATEQIPVWVRILCALAIALGTIGGGWKIMKTLGRRIFPIKPIDSLDSQITASSSILLSTAVGAPISSSQVVASSILGVGTGENAKMVQWSVGKHMLVSWLLTIPASAALSAIVFNILKLLSNL